MEIKINENLREAIINASKDAGVGVDEFVNGLLEYSFDNGLAVLQMARVEELLTRELLPRLMNVQAGQFSARHQIMNIHADILDGDERAVAIAKEADEIGYEMVFGDNEGKE